ncbi:hypothetical protein MWN33_14030 [Starkeya koreensis]|uniref:Uncharacterized protein n=1 Tax=Ancylobacter koreensis TaxID=266121 RepID=A0ABT0DPG7_9HYPH|nr:hypothetical protein [Ancylobacter koreensis]MCK0209150.1 hypothetical protein [Ancylobacter koreensis]
MAPVFLIWAPPYATTSSGIRALYRLCHHLNEAGYPSAMVARRIKRLPKWNIPFHRGGVGDSIVIYPEIVPGNPLAAEKVVRWALNDPGLLGGETTYADEEMVFVYDPQRLEAVSRAVKEPLGPRRVLWMGLIDPDVIYPDPSVPKTIDCSFIYKGRALSERFPLPEGIAIEALEDRTPNMAALGDTLRRTRTLYSYDHYSNVLREAAISGCELRVIGEDGVWHDPRGCSCPKNIWWYDDLLGSYARRYSDSAFTHDFVREVRTRWSVPQAAPPGKLRRFWRRFRPFG